ncbi:MAG: C13 family peptidase [Gemmatimonadetes bacterium]|nr:C13 family peptidase [Gemmatimonadota bacterium]
MKSISCRLSAIGLALFGLVAAPSIAGAQTQLLVVSGLAGEPRFEQEFGKWGTTLVDAAAKRFGLRPEQIVYLADKPASDAARIDARSTKAEVEKAIRAMAQRAGPSDRVLVVLIGHGASDSEGARINLSGPDLRAEELASYLNAFTTQKVVVVNTASASGDFQQPLAGKNRTIITATKSGSERNETVFGRYFVQSFAGDVADTDKDGRITMLEAFHFTQREVERHYKDANHLQTEHAVLAGDQELARGFYLVAASSAPTTAASAEVRALIEQRQQIEARVEALRARRASVPAAEYAKQMEDLLVELALKTREIRAKGGS